MKYLNKSLAYALLAGTAFTTSAMAGSSTDFDLSSASLGGDSPLQVGGYFESRNQYFLSDSTHSEDWLSLRQRVGLDVTYKFDNITLFAAGYAEHDGATNDYRSARHGELTEAYAKLDGENTDLTVGKRIITWGAADGRRTIDRINAVNLKDPIGNGRTTARRANWLVHLEHSLNNSTTLEGVYLPFGRDTELPEHGSPWEPMALYNLRYDAGLGFITLVERDEDDGEGGARISHFGEGFDISAAFYSGYTDNRVIVEQTMSTIVLAPVRTETYNLSGATPHGNGTLRGELSYTPDMPLGMGQETDLLQGIVGWDTTFGIDTLVSLQLFVDSYDDMDDTYGATFSVLDKICDDQVDVGLRGQLANDDQYVAEAFATYPVNDGLSLTARGMWFGGEDGTPIDEFSKNDFVELSARLTF